MKHISRRIVVALLTLAFALPMLFAAPAYAETPNSLEDSVQTYSASPKGAKSASVDFSQLQKAYRKANAFLIDLDAKAALYNVNSMQALIDAASASGVAEYLGAEDLSGFTPEDEEAANLLADNINLAYSSLQSVSGSADLSAYMVAAETVNKLDSDIYSSTKSIGSAIRIANILVKTSKLTYTDALDGENTSTISAFKETATQQNVDDATRTILDALYVSVKAYTVTTSDTIVDTSFQNGTSTGDNSPYTATYGSTVIAYTDIEDTAWYMDFSSETATRSRQFQGYGESFRAKVFGNMNIYAETRSTQTPNMIKIHRVYDNNSEKSALQLMTFADSSYELPLAKACQNYVFKGYYIGYDTDNLLSEGDVISVSRDTKIQAYYEYSGDADCAVNATALENGIGFNDSVAYNTKIELSGGDNCYAWIETVDASQGEYRPFAIGSDISFLASESITLTAVTQEGFDDFGFSLPAINMRKTGAIIEGTKVIFNGQIFETGDRVREYGAVIGVNKNGYELDEEDLTVENAGNFEDYTIIRAKSTRYVGAHQFSICINGLASKDYIYKGYAIYEKVNGEFVTLYTDTMTS